MTRPPGAALVVVGVGNLLRGDDAAGIAVLRRLRPRPGVRLLALGGEATALVEALRGAAAAIVVDAAAGARPGSWQRLDAAAQALPEGLFGRSTHGFGVAAGLELARALGTLPGTCVLYALGGAQFRVGAAMSAAVEAALPMLAARIEAEIDAVLARQAAAVFAWRGTGALPV